MKLQVGVKALIQNERDEYLFLQRAEAMDNEKEAHWDIPGGRIEPDESLMTALQREILEETGLEITATPNLLGAQDIFVASKDLHVVRLTYTLKASGTVTLSHEHQATRWMSLDDAASLNLDPYLTELIKK